MKRACFRKPSLQALRRLWSNCERLISSHVIASLSPGPSA